METAMEGARQPYHFVEGLELEEGERHIKKCATASRQLAVQAIREMLDAVSARNYRVIGCAMLLASGRALPSLSKILASHALVHTAEGEFFREVVREACEHWRVPVLGLRERELEAHADAAFGKTAARLREHIASLGKTVGPPWTQDEKTAALAGLVVSRLAARALPNLRKN